MAQILGEVAVEISGDDRKLDKSFRQAEQKTQRFGGVMQGILQGVGQGIFNTFAGAARGVFNKITDEIGKATDAASDLQESVNKTNVVFGNSAAEILEWSKTSATAFGQSRQQALEAAAGFGNLFVSMGLARSEAASMSVELVELASDIASINNIDPAAALEKLRAGLVGETEPLRTVGVLLSAARVEAKAFELGLASTSKELSESDKALARYQLILDDTRITQGDFARTSQQAANAQRILVAQIQDARAEFGQLTLPIKTAIVRGLSNIITTIRPFGRNFLDSLAAGMAQGITALVPVLMNIRRLFQFWLRPGSPPRLLPELTRWGQSAMDEYLSGWSKGNFDILSGVGSAIEGILRSFVASGKLDETDLVSRILGSRDAIIKAIAEFKQFGQVSDSTLNSIIRNAGPAGNAVAGLVSAYFDLQRASEGVRRAQDELNRVTDEYDAILNPLRGKLDEVRDAQRRLQDEQRKIALTNIIRNFESTAAEKQAAALELQEIALSQQIDTIEEQKEVAEDAAQSNLDAATKEQEAAQEKLDSANALLQQQVETNNLIGEQIALEERLRAEREAAAQAAASEAESLRQAMLQYQLGISDTAGKLAILRAELAKTEVGSVEHFQLLGQIHDLEAQGAEEAKQNAERLAAAQLNYRLQLADTSGQIAIWREELAKVPPGTVEYIEILTTIAGLEQQLANQAGGSGAGLGGALEDLAAEGGPVSEATKGFVALEEAITKAFNTLAAPSTSINADLPDSMQAISDELPESWLDFALRMEKVFQGLRDAVDGTAVALGIMNAEGASPEAKAFAENIHQLAEDLQLIAKIFSQGPGALFEEGAPLGDFFKITSTGGGLLGLLGMEEGEKIDLAQLFTFGEGDFGPFTLFKAALQSIRDLLPFGGEPVDAASPLFGLGKSGLSVVNNIMDGITIGATELIRRMRMTWGIFRDLLPFSEPADASSPLFGLSKAGEGILQNIMDGLGLKWTELKQWFIDSYQAVRDLLPIGGEPADASSPLMNLAAAGLGILQNIWDGLQEKWLELDDWWNGENGVWKGFTKVIADLDTVLYDAGFNLLDQLWDGLKAKWTSISDWWSGPGGVWSTFADTLPFSEPKDPSSPLRGLGKAGESIIGQIQAGMDRATANLSTSLGGLRDPALAAAGATSNTTNMGGVQITQNFYGPVDEKTVREASKQGLRDALRQRGVSS